MKHTLFSTFGLSLFFKVVIFSSLILHASLVSAWGNKGHPGKYTFSLACDLETFNEDLRFEMNYKEGMIRFKGDMIKVPISESSAPMGGFDFNFQRVNQEKFSCNILMPSGALQCATNEGNTLVGFCLLDSK